LGLRLFIQFIFQIVNPQRGNPIHIVNLLQYFNRYAVRGVTNSHFYASYLESIILGIKKSKESYFLLRLARRAFGVVVMDVYDRIFTQCGFKNKIIKKSNKKSISFSISNFSTK